MMMLVNFKHEIVVIELKCGFETKKQFKFLARKIARLVALGYDVWAGDQFTFEHC
jgi:hypothetical protein